MTKILLVEDDKGLREIYGVRLLAEGYDIVSAGDGEEALAMAIKERPNLILSDVMMPKISGFDMLDILRSTTETKDIKVIIMTALSSEDQRSRGEALGADLYLVKSQVGIEDVVKAVKDVLMKPAPPAPQEQLQAQAMPPQPTMAPHPVSTPQSPADSLRNISNQTNYQTQASQAVSQQPVAPQYAPQQPQPQPQFQPQPQAQPPVRQTQQPAIGQPLPAPGQGLAQQIPQRPEQFGVPPREEGLPLPTAPFSTERKKSGSISERVIQPPARAQEGETYDVARAMADALNNNRTNPIGSGSVASGIQPPAPINQAPQMNQPLQTPPMAPNQLNTQPQMPQMNNQVPPVPNQWPNQPV